MEFLVAWGRDLGMRQSWLYLVILTKLHRLVYFEERREEEQNITSRIKSRTRDLLNTREDANHYIRQLVSQLATKIAMRCVACTLTGKEVQWQ